MTKPRSVFADRVGAAIISAIQEAADDETRHGQPACHAISLYVSFIQDDPMRPVVAVGAEVPPDEDDAYERWLTDSEWQWNYAAWGQRLDREIGDDDATAGLLAGVDESGSESAVVGELIRLVRTLHAAKVTEHYLGRKVPMIIHKLTYSRGDAERNASANGAAAVKGFTDWIREGYEFHAKSKEVQLRLFDDAVARGDRHFRETMSRLQSG